MSHVSPSGRQTVKTVPEARNAARSIALLGESKGSQGRLPRDLNGRAKVSGLQKWFLYVRDTFLDVSFVPCPSAFGHIGFLLALTYW